MKRQITILSMLVALLALSASAQWVTQTPATSATWTSATSTDAALPVSVVSYSLASVTLATTSSVTDGALWFELSNDRGATYPFMIACPRTDKAEADSRYHIASASTATNRAWQCPVAGFTNFRVRLNPAISGGGSAIVTVTVTQAPISSPTVTVARGSTTQVTGPFPAQPSLIPVLSVAAPPPLTPTQLANPLLYRAAMRIYCQTNLSGCAPGL